MKAASTPATDPLVTAVGGTGLIADPRPARLQRVTCQPLRRGCHAFGSIRRPVRLGERVNEGVGSATGGGISTVYGRPDYQAPIVKDTKMREIPDVAYTSAVERARVPRRLTCPAPAASARPRRTVPSFRLRRDERRLAAVGRVSPRSTDQMAGGRVGDINKTLYHLGEGQGRRRVLPRHRPSGDNSVPADRFTGTPITGFSAVSGWDAATGWGSPIANALVPAIAKPGNGLRSRTSRNHERGRRDSAAPLLLLAGAPDREHRRESVGGVGHGEAVGAGPPRIRQLCPS